MASSVGEPAEWLRLAWSTLEAARVLLEQDHTRDAVSRSYYAMFYAAKAAVVSEGLQARKHSSVISMFGRHFSKTGRISSQAHKSLMTAFDERQLADYSLDWPSDTETASKRLDQALDAVATPSNYPSIPSFINHRQLPQPGPSSFPAVSAAG